MTNSSEESLLSRLSVCHGPRELMERFFIKILQALSDRGVSMRVSDFSELESINKKNSESWRPLFPSFSPSIGGAENRDGFTLIGTNHQGEVVATQAARVFDWRDTNFKREARSLRLLYSDPASMAQDDETCEATAPIAKSITGRVGLGGGIWYHPSYRGRQLSELIPRLTRAYAFVTYGTDQHVGLVSPDNVARGLHIRHGFREHSEFLMMRNSHSYPGKDVSMTVLRMRPHEIIDDAFLHLVHWAPKVD